MERRINVVQKRRFKVHVVPQEGVDGEEGAYYFSVFIGIDNSSNLNVVFSAEVSFCFLK